MAKTKRKAKPKVIKVHLDADYLAYSAGFAAQHTDYMLTHEGKAVGQYGKADEVKEALKLYEAEGKPVAEFLKWERITVEPVENALHTIKVQIKDILEQVEGKFPGLTPELCLYLTGTGNFREKIATIKPYKGNRPPWHKPRLYRECRAYMVNAWGAVVVHDQEADDEVVIQQIAANEAGIPSVIVGIDKDLWQCPGWHYSTSKRGFARISPAMGLRLFYRQVLTGDATDNIGGVYRLGKVKAKAMILPGMAQPEMHDICLRAYADSVEKYGPEKCGYAVAAEALAENVDLLWLRRRPDQWFEDWRSEAGA